MGDTFCKIPASCIRMQPYIFKLAPHRLLPLRVEKPLLEGVKGLETKEKEQFVPNRKEINVLPCKNDDRAKLPRSVIVVALIIIFDTFLYAIRSSTVQFQEQEPFHVLGSDCQCSIDGFAFVVGDQRLCFRHDSREPVAQGVPRCRTELR